MWAVDCGRLCASFVCVHVGERQSNYWGNGTETAGRCRAVSNSPAGVMMLQPPMLLMVMLMDKLIGQRCRKPTPRESLISILDAGEQGWGMTLQLYCTYVQCGTAAVPSSQPVPAPVWPRRRRLLQILCLGYRLIIEHTHSNSRPDV